MAHDQKINITKNNYDVKKKKNKNDKTSTVRQYKMRDKTRERRNAMQCE